MEANGPSASEGRLRSPAGAYTSVQSPEGVPVFGASEASEDGSKRPERSEGRLRSPAGAYTSVQSPAGVPVFGASEASEDGSKRPERKRGSFALTRRGIYQCSITRRGGDR